MSFALVSTVDARRTEGAGGGGAASDARGQMYALAPAGAAGRPARAIRPPAQQQAAIEAALELTYAQRPARAGLMDAAKAALGQSDATSSARRGLVTMPTAPVKIITMPKFQQGNAVAYCDPPGAARQGAGHVLRHLADPRRLERRAGDLVPVANIITT